MAGCNRKLLAAPVTHIITWPMPKTHPRPNREWIGTLPQLSQSHVYSNTRKNDSLNVLTHGHHEPHEPPVMLKVTNTSVTVLCRHPIWQERGYEDLEHKYSRPNSIQRSDAATHKHGAAAPLTWPRSEPQVLCQKSNRARSIRFEFELIDRRFGRRRFDQESSQSSISVLKLQLNAQKILKITRGVKVPQNL